MAEETTSKLDPILKPYQSDMDTLISLVPDELSSNKQAYLALIITQLMRSNDNNPPRLSDLLSFMYQVNRTKLDPLNRQIYGIYRKGALSVQTSIDGFRLVADRTGLYGGQDDAVYDTEDTQHPNKATVTVYKLNPRNGERMPVTASARWSEYGSSGPMWSRMGYLMLAKCAEALALRKAFPQELSGLYTTEEMMQADNQPNHRERIDVAVSEYSQPEPIVEEAPKEQKTQEEPVKDPAYRTLAKPKPQFPKPAEFKPQPLDDEPLTSKE